MTCPENCGCTITGGIQGYGWGPGQPDLLGGEPALTKGLSAVPAQDILQFYDSMNLIGLFLYLFLQFI